jgi:hypothetical protein
LKEKEAAAFIILPEVVSKYMYNIYQKKAQYVLALFFNTRSLSLTLSSQNLKTQQKRI